MPYRKLALKKFNDNGGLQVAILQILLKHPEGIAVYYLEVLHGI